MFISQEIVSSIQIPLKLVETGVSDTKYQLKKQERFMSRFSFVIRRRHRYRMINVHLCNVQFERMWLYICSFSSHTVLWRTFMIPFVSTLKIFLSNWPELGASSSGYETCLESEDESKLRSACRKHAKEGTEMWNYYAWPTSWRNLNVEGGMLNSECTETQRRRFSGVAFMYRNFEKETDY